MSGVAGRSQPLRGDLPAGGVLAHRWHETAPWLHAFELHAQYIDDVCVGNIANIVGNCDTVVAGGERVRNECWRANQCHLCPHSPEPANVRACNPAVQDIPNNRDVHPLHPPQCLANGVQVEQALRGMLVEPSPALRIDALVCWAAIRGAPTLGWRNTIASGE